MPFNAINSNNGRYFYVYKQRISHSSNRTTIICVKVRSRTIISLMWGGNK